MTKAYKGAILYFLLFSTLLLISSILLFEYKIGFSIEEVSRYYLGDEELFIPTKTVSGILKITLPHIFVFGLFSMVVLHFIVFTSYREKKNTTILVYLLFISSFFELFSPIIIILGFESFAYLKLFSFFVFECLIIYILYLLFFSIVYE